MNAHPFFADPSQCSPEQVQSWVTEIESTYLLDKPRKIGMERRAAERLVVTMPVSISPLDDDLKPGSYQLNAITRDLSVKGVGLVATSPIARDYVALTFEPFQGDSFEIIAKVIYCNDLGYYFQIGCEFQVS